MNNYIKGLRILGCDRAWFPYSVIWWYFYILIGRRFMTKVKIGDCFLSKKSGNNLICVISILDDFCSVKILGMNETFSIPIYRLVKLTYLGNMYESDVLKILFDK